MIHSLYILNRAGGLIYHTDFHSDIVNKLTANEYLVLAGTIQGVFAIAARTTPSALKLTQGATAGVNGGLRAIETDAFTIFLHQTVTGVKFLLVASPSGNDLDQAMMAADAVLGKVYCLYADYVMKNPFHSLEMPIRAHLFDRKVSEVVKSVS